jgi:hypothetical protein
MIRIMIANLVELAVGQGEKASNGTEAGAFAPFGLCWYRAEEGAF